MLISGTFLASSLLVIMAPGPDLMLLTRMLVRGASRTAATASAAGMITAGAGYAVVGLSGLALLLRATPWLFLTVRAVGAAILFGWGVLLVLATLRRSGAAPVAPIPSGRAYWQGFACTGANPKVGFFLVAFLPQFVPSGAPVVSATFVLALVYLALGFGWLMIWIHLLHRIGGRLLRPPITRLADRLLGVVFMAIGVCILLAG